MLVVKNRLNSISTYEKFLRVEGGTRMKMQNKLTHLTYAMLKVEVS
jgi:hypothetical protein